MKKRIIVCCDGTWNDLEMRYITNVARLAQALLPVSPEPGRIPQIIYYDDGIGSEDRGLRRLISGGTGIGMERNIYEAYRFLCFNYEDGDELCLFGFSRGAYTVRSLAGMIGRSGLVSRLHVAHVPEALTIYRDRGDPGNTKANRFKKRYSRDVSIALLGCWDTVGALGIPDKLPWLPIDDWTNRKFEFHDTLIGPHVECALHAVAIDERRKEFDVTRMTKAPTASMSQIVNQVWFPGDHGCVGGGRWEKRGLSNAAFRWMIAEARELGVDLGVDVTRLRDNAMTDHSVFFDGDVGGIYSEHERTVTGGVTALHDTVKLRWHDLDDYRPANLIKFVRHLDAFRPSGDEGKIRKSASLLKSRAHVDVRVMARDKVGMTGIKVEGGARYKIEISPLQVWKDGELDPVNVTGWNEKRAWKGGEKEKFGQLRSAILAASRKKTPCPRANWFEVVASVDGQIYFDLRLREFYEIDTVLSREFTAKGNGTLRLAANDLAHERDLIDKYDNNRGWIWLRVHRL